MANEIQFSTEPWERWKAKRIRRRYIDRLAEMSATMDIHTDPLFEAIEDLREVVANLAVIECLIDEDRDEAKRWVDRLIESTAEAADKAVRAFVDRERGSA